MYGWFEILCSLHYRWIRTKERDIPFVFRLTEPRISRKRNKPHWALSQQLQRRTKTKTLGGMKSTFAKKQQSLNTIPSIMQFRCFLPKPPSSSILRPQGAPKYKLFCWLFNSGRMYLLNAFTCLVYFVFERGWGLPNAKSWTHPWDFLLVNGFLLSFHILAMLNAVNDRQICSIVCLEPKSEFKKYTSEYRQQTALTRE